MAGADYLQLTRRSFCLPSSGVRIQLPYRYSYANAHAAPRLQRARSVAATKRRLVLPNAVATSMARSISRQLSLSLQRLLLGSDEQWSKLLKDITDGVEKSLTQLEEADEEPDAVTKVRDQFRLDARSVPATLDGLTLKDVRQAYLEGSGVQPMRGGQPGNWGTVIFLLADAQVLQDPDLRLLKVADAIYDPVAAVPKNTRAGLQRSFGWITIPTAAVLDFYNWMDMFTFGETVSQAGSGPGAFWNPYEQC